MNRLLKSVLAFFLVITCFGLNSNQVKAESVVITNFEITIDLDKIVVCPTASGKQITSKLLNGKYVTYGSYSYYIDDEESGLYYKENDSYISLTNSNELLTDDKDYYLRLEMMSRLGHGEFDVNTLPTATVNGDNVDTAWHYQQLHGIVTVYYPIEFDEDGLCVFSVSIDPVKKNLRRNEGYQFTAEVVGNPDTVTWSISGNSSERTRISQDGYLYPVSIFDETSNKITVIATSTYDSDVYATAEVTLLNDAPYISSVKLNKTKGNVRRGESIVLAATVKGTAEDTLIWSMSGNHSSNTTLTCTDNLFGTLSVASDEPLGTKIIVTATSKCDPTKKATYKATVSKNTTISSIKVTYNKTTAVLKQDTKYSDIKFLTGEPSGFYPIDVSSSDYYCERGAFGTYLLVKEGNQYVEADKYSTEIIDYEKEYLLVLTIKTREYTQFNTKKLPTIKVNGSTPYKVEWADKSAHGAIRVYVKYNSFMQNYTKTKATCKVEPNDETSLKITAGDAFGAASYEFYRSTKKTGKYIFLGKQTEPTYIDNDLTCGKTYYYKTVAFYDDGTHNYKSATSSIVAGVVAPAAINSLSTYNKSSTAATITWGNVANATGYKIYRATSLDGTYKYVKSVKANDDNNMMFTDTKLKPNTHYYYKVYSYKTVNKKEIINKNSPITGVYTCPASPKFTVETKNGYNYITISKVDGAYFYCIQRGFGGNFYTECQINDKEFDKTYTYRDAGIGIHYGTDFYYRVYCFSMLDGRQSDYSKVIIKKVIPDAPVVTLTTSSKKVTINYTQEEITNGGYEIYRSTKKSSGYKLIYSNDANTFTYEDTTKKGTTYYYRVRSYAYADDGITKVYSNYSKVKSIKSK